MTNDRHYLLDVTRLVWRRWTGRLPTGIDRVCNAYLDHFGADSQAVIQRAGFRRILSVEASDRLFELLRAPREDIRPALGLALAGVAVRPSDSGKDRLYFNLGHTGLGDHGLQSWVNNARLRPLHFVHDLIPITHPEYCRAGEAERHRRRIFGMLRTASGIIANSRATLESLDRFRIAEGLPAVPTLAAPLGSDSGAARPPSSSTDRPPRFVILGTIEARKNHLMLLEIWQRLVQKLGERAPRLTIVGQRGWECEEVFAILDSGALRGAVMEVNHADDEQLAEHLADARALLFPSLIEGYGLPLVEALRAGTPVIASDLPVFREIGAGMPDFLDPRDSSAWERAILDYADPLSAVRAAQLDRLRDFRAPTWDDHFAAVEGWLDRLGKVRA